MHVEKRYLEIVAQTMPCKKHQIEDVLKMLEEGNTVPFIARYRKERTGSLDEVQIKEISDEYQRVEKIEKKRSDIEARIGELGKLTENLKKSIGCNTLIIKGCTQFFFKIHDFGSAPLIIIAPFSFVFMVFTRGFMRMVRTVSEGWMSLMVS